jgi:hypothetical protein
VDLLHDDGHDEANLLPRHDPEKLRGNLALYRATCRNRLQGNSEIACFPLQFQYNSTQQAGSEVFRDEEAAGSNPVTPILLGAAMSAAYFML